MGLYNYAARTSRRAIEVLSRAGLCASYLTIRRAAAALSMDAKTKLRIIIRLPGVRFFICYDNLNWMEKVKDRTANNRSKMRAAVHGNIAIVAWKTAYKPASSINPRASIELFRRVFGRRISPPTEIEQPLMELAHKMRSMHGDAKSMAKTSAPPRLVEGGDESDDDMDDVFFDALDHPDKIEQSIREERDTLRAAPLPSSATPRNFLAGHLEADHLCKAMLSHIYHSWIDMHPEYEYLQPDVPNPPQVLPLIPERSIIRPLPVIDEDEGTVIGNINTIQNYIKYLGLTDEELGQMVIPVTGDAYTFGKNIHGVHRRRRDLDPDQPNLERLQFVQSWPALFHAQVRLDSISKITMVSDLLLQHRFRCPSSRTSSRITVKQPIRTIRSTSTSWRITLDSRTYSRTPSNITTGKDS
jgi:hypothetical protein